jgi:hypothetical protein
MNLQTVKEINFDTDLFVPEGFQFMKQELALFLLGSPMSEYSVQELHIQQCLTLLTPQEDKIVLKLRALWFLEKMARHESLMNRRNEQG